MAKRTRFAPSPTGLLHLGNAYSALCCEQWAKAQDAELLLRIEDIDHTRCRKEFADKMLQDLSWLGIPFDGEVVFQQQRLPLYARALQALEPFLYPCFCTRSQIKQAMAGKPHQDKLDGYPGTCKTLSMAARQAMMREQAFAWRLDMDKVALHLGEQGYWRDMQGEKHRFDMSAVGDVVIGRKDIRFSYHLCVVVDDAAQGITHVIRGQDLQDSTPVHRILQQLLGYSELLYMHHKLITDTQGMRMAKRKQSPSLASLREDGVSPEDVRRMLGF